MMADENVPTASEVLAARGTPEVQPILSEDEIEKEQSYGYLDRTLDLYVEINNKQWTYKVSGSEPYRTEFLLGEDKDALVSIQIGSKQITVSGTEDEAIEEYWQNIIAASHIKDYVKNQFSNASINGQQYDAEYLLNKENVHIRYYMWIYDNRFYYISAISDDKHEELVFKTMEKMVETFCSYSEYKQYR